MPKPINSDASELLQTKTENSQCKDSDIIKEDACYKIKKQEPINSFIDCLIKGQDTKLLKSDKEKNANTALELEFKSHSLSVVPLFHII